MSILKRLEEHIEFHEAIDKHKSDAAFLRVLKAYIEDLEAKLKTAKRDAIKEAHRYAVANGSEHCPEDWLAYIDTI